MTVAAVTIVRWRLWRYLEQKVGRGDNQVCGAPCDRLDPEVHVTAAD